VTRVEHHVDRVQRLPAVESDRGPTGRADHRAVRRRGEDGENLGIRTEERHRIDPCGDSRNQTDGGHGHQKSSDERPE
jgi:hypothetical protein